MITCYFGVPRVGKNTLLTKIARRSLYKKMKGQKRYEHVYTSFSCAGCEKIDFDKLGDYKFYNSLIIFDELALDADNREFKKFRQEIRDFLVLHGHLGNDIIYATQNYQNVDKKVRELTDELWYLSKSVVPFLRQFTVARRIYRNISINEFTSELVLGYRFCNFLEKLFVRNTMIVFRPLYYRFFNSWEEGVLAERTVYQSELWKIEKRPKESVVDRLNARSKLILAKSTRLKNTIYNKRNMK